MPPLLPIMGEGVGVEGSFAFVQEVYSIDFLLHSGIEPNNHACDLVSDRQLNTTFSTAFH
ncbi:hypothetical protein [Nostoc sp.]|uniref:hypothetical protein n=1 Tax=Nostoc sp. TaxID=1180 RepID=UPI002FF79D23